MATGRTTRRRLISGTMLAALLGTTGIALAQEDPLSVGAVIPLTGTYGFYGQQLTAGLEVAADEVNNAGGVLGMPMELYIEDDQTDATAGLNAARKLIDVQGVDAIVGTFASSVTLPILNYTTQIGIPMLTIAGAPEIRDIGLETGLVYRFGASDGALGKAYARYALKEGLDRAYLMAANNAALIDAATQYEAVYAEAGAEVLGTTIFEPNQASYRSEITKALADDPDVVMLAAYTNDAIILAKTLLQLDPDVKIVGPLYSFGEQWIEGVGAEAVEGTLAVDLMAAEGTPAFDHLAPIYTEAAGQSPTSNPYGVMDYDMVITLALAATAANSTDPEVFTPFIAQVANAPGVEVATYAEGVAALEAGEEINYVGASSPVDFDETGDLVAMYMRTYTIEGGQAVAGDVLEP